MSKQRRAARPISQLMLKSSPMDLDAVQNETIGEISTFSFRTAETLSSDLIKLRRIGLGIPLSETVPVVDAFDENAIYPGIYQKDACCGFLRVTNSASARMLSTWSNGRFPYEPSEQFAELSRSVVAPEWRGRNIYKILMLQTLLYLDGKYSRAYSLIEPNFVGKRFLLTIGFEELGEPLWADDLPHSTLATPIVIDFGSSNRDRWQTLLAQMVRLSGA